MIRYALAAAAALATASPALAQTALNATFTGTAQTSQLNPVPGQQTFTLSGNFLTYAASPNLPQITGGDLNRYSFTVTGLSQAYDAATRTTTYGNVVGTIFYNYPNNTTDEVQIFNGGPLTATFDPLFATAVLNGSLFSTGPQTPTGFPGPVDFSPANGAQITGLYVSTAPQNGTVTGAITFVDAAGAVPEPATWAMMIGGFGAIGASMRRRKVAVRFA